MKLLKRIWNPVTVDYFGLLMPVPSGIKWLATDVKGDLYGFEREPVCDAGRCIWRGSGAIRLSSVDLDGRNWIESMVTL